MFNKGVNYLLDGASGSTLIVGIMWGQNIAIFLGGLASIMAFVNHFDQYQTRKNERKNNKVS